MQPLDVSFFGRTEKYYDEAMRSWLHSNVGHAVTTWQVAELFGKLYGKAASVNTATSGFRASGLIDKSHVWLLLRQSKRCHVSARKTRLSNCGQRWQW